MTKTVSFTDIDRQCSVKARIKAGTCIPNGEGPTDKEVEGAGGIHLFHMPFNPATNIAPIGDEVFLFNDQLIHRYPFGWYNVGDIQLIEVRY